MPRQREGSPFTGLATVAMKEAADHMTSARIHLVLLLIFLTAIGAVYAAIGQITATIGEDQFLFLRLFTTARDPLPSFVAFLSFLLPLVSITLGFDAINGEYNRRTLSRILAQPIYRDALLAGKFVGGLIVLAICLLTLWLLVTGMGILMLGLPPSGEEVLRSLAFLLASFVYAGRMAGGGAGVLDAVPLARYLCACRADAMAGVHGVLVDAGAADRRGAGPDRPEQPDDANPSAPAREGDRRAYRRTCFTAK